MDQILQGLYKNCLEDWYQFFLQFIPVCSVVLGSNCIDGFGCHCGFPVPVEKIHEFSLQ